MSPFAQLRLLLFRSLREGGRNPVLAYALPIIIPLAVLVLVAKTLYRVTDLPGFPTSNYAEWMTPAIIMLTAMTGVGYAATSLVVDIQSGFLDRLRLLDVRPPALLMSRVLFDVVRVVPTGAVLLVVGLLLGTHLNEGVLGVALLFGLLVLWAAAYGGLYFVVALTTGNAQAPLALAPLFLPLQFLSTQFVPRSLLPGWVQAVAAWNPFTYMVDAARAMTTGPMTFAPVAKAVGVALAMLVVTQTASLRAYKRASGGL
ncbi:MAG TPA: ABC transporter permease [Cryptosporangiaceae bacterium]|nr:ABC transporter permease [Cryptosporangiaceae bacterium]